MDKPVFFTLWFNENSKSDSWLFQVHVVENQYPHENSQCLVENRSVRWTTSHSFWNFSMIISFFEGLHQNSSRRTLHESSSITTGPT